MIMIMIMIIINIKTEYETLRVSAGCSKPALFLRTAENPQARRTIAAHRFLCWNSSVQYIEIPCATYKTMVREHQLEHSQLH